MLLNRKTMMYLFAFLSLFISSMAMADNGLLNRSDVQAFIQATAKQYQLDPSYIKSTLAQAQYLPDVIPQMEHPAEAKPWAFYRNFFITPDRIQDGVNFYNQYQTVLNQAQAKYGVPTSVIVGILGMETRYGQIMGSYRVLDTLTTLAFAYPPREQFFKSELAQFLYMSKKYNINPLTLMGSRSGAIGLCQFMPSSYLAYAVSYENNGQAPNIFGNPKDAIFSIANFLSQQGWVRDGAITSPADVTGHSYKQLVKTDPMAVHEPSVSLATFKQAGVVPAGSFNPSDYAYLMILQVDNGREYWLGFHNFHVITKYNNSDLYAMSVYQFGDLVYAGATQTASHVSSPVTNSNAQ